MSRHQYRYLSADPGAGKTEWAIKKVARTLAYNPVLMVVPTRNLCDEIQRRSGGQIEAIHSGVLLGEPVGPHIQARMSECNRTHHNRAFVITDAAYSHLHVRYDSWVVIKDEPEEPLMIQNLDTTDSWRFIAEHVFHFDPHPTRDEFYRLRVRKPLTYSMSTELDSVFGPLFELAEYLYADAHYEVLVDRDSWDQGHRLRYSVFQLPEAWSDWGEVWFMGANFEDSLIYNQWRHLGVEWIPHSTQLPTMPTDRLRIHYLFDDIAWSAQTRNRVRSGQTNLAWYLDWIRTEMPNGNYVYVANNGYDDEVLSLTGQRMPAECHGLNQWREETNCVLLASYHQFQGDELFYQYYKTSTADIRGMRNAQYYVQQLTRTNIRVYDSDLPVNAYVPTLREALDILKYFRDARIVSPFGQEWRLRANWEPRELLDDTVPDQEWLTMGPNTFANAVAVGPDGQVIESFMETASNDTANALFTPFQQKTASLYNIMKRNIAETGPSGSKATGASDTRIDGLPQGGRRATRWPGSPWIQMILDWSQECSLADWSGSRDQFKKNLPWFCPGLFRTGSSMRKENCLGVSILGFDFDDARFTNREVEEIFRGTEHLIYTTVSHDSQKPFRKLRIVVPISRPISRSEHERIMAYYSHEFGKLGKGEIDPATTGAERKFYIPHFESDTHWVRNRKTPLNVDRLLLKIPKVPLVQAPQRGDLIPVNYDPVQAGADALQRIQAVIASMTPGDRSHKATRVGGMLRNIDPALHEQVFQDLRLAGVDPAAIKSARRYANGT